jgi:hypothetical protein
MPGLIMMGGYRQGSSFSFLLGVGRVTPTAQASKFPAMVARGLAPLPSSGAEALIHVKIVAFAPMPRASVITTADVKPRRFRSVRTLYRMSCQKVSIDDASARDEAILARCSQPAEVPEVISPPPGSVDRGALDSGLCSTVGAQERGTRSPRGTCMAEPRIPDALAAVWFTLALLRRTWVAQCEAERVLAWWAEEGPPRRVRETGPSGRAPRLTS